MHAVVWVLIIPGRFIWLVVVGLLIVRIIGLRVEWWCLVSCGDLMRWWLARAGIHVSSSMVLVLKLQGWRWIDLIVVWWMLELILMVLVNRLRWIQGVRRWGMVFMWWGV